MFVLVGLVVFFAVVIVLANRRQRRVDAHLAVHGIDDHARVVDVQRSNYQVNQRRGWTLILAWRHPQTGAEHRLESDLVWRPNGFGYSPRAELIETGELPVRVDPSAPEQFHAVDTSSLRQ